MISGFCRRLLNGAAMLAAMAAPALAVADNVLDPANFDAKVPPCEDFYEYATGGWRAAHPIPGYLSSWNAFTQVAETNFAKMHEVLDKLVAKPDTSDPDFARIANYYKSCMDESRVERDGAAWLQARLAPIDALNSRSDIIAAVARLHREGVPVFFDFGAEADGKDSDRQDAAIAQGGLSLPNRDYYTRDDAGSKILRERFVAHVARMLALAGEEQAKAEADARAILDLETRLALASRTPVELRDPLKNYNLLPMATLQGLSPGFDWAVFMRDAGAPPVSEVNVGQPDFVKGLGKVLTEADPAALKAYMKWRVVVRSGDALPRRFVDERFTFTRLLTGAQENRPRWERCIQSTAGVMQDAIGKAFVKYLVPRGTKERAIEMVHNLRETLAQDIQELDWMGPDTKKLALGKLAAMTEHVGYPDKPIDYSALKLTGDEIFGDAQLTALRFAEQRDLAKIGKPTDREEWSMTAMEVNAYYESETNSINFPAAILLPPFFDVTADDAVNYGAIGAVIGHEMTHGFDDQGRRYDGKGNLKEWWSEADARNFDRLGQCIVEQFDSFVAGGDLHENGRLEEGEAIADLGGVTIAHRALLKTPQAQAAKPIGGLTPDQRFFAAFAQIWEANIRPEAARTQALTDPHPLSRFRVIGTLGNVPAFAKAYNCPANAPMVRQTRCKIW